MKTDLKTIVPQHMQRIILGSLIFCICEATSNDNPEQLNSST